MTHLRPTIAEACTVTPDLAHQLDALLTARDNIRDLYEHHHVRLVHALLARVGTEAACELAHRAGACAEAADQAADAALRLAMDALRCCGVAVEVPAADDCQPEPADNEGGAL